MSMNLDQTVDKITPSTGTLTVSSPIAIGSGNSTLGSGDASLMKNRIINGAMVIDQRNAGASVTPTATNTYTLDRWQAQLSVSSKYSVQQNAGSVTPPVGFTNYLGVTSLAATSVGSTDYYAIRQIIEGFNIADLGWGTANAKSITLSFQVYSSLTGTFGGYLNNATDNYCYPFTYTISSANTWTSISITIAGPTSGTWNTTNGQGIKVGFGLGVGSTYSGTSGSWSANNYLSATGATSVVGTSGATFYITGVQLEVGSSATGYEYRMYGTELDLCQRYYHSKYTRVSSITSDGLTCYYPVSMRTTPTIGGSGTGFTTTNTTYEVLYCYQTTAAWQTLTFSAEL
jgi:hypothetical protein